MVTRATAKRAVVELIAVFTILALTAMFTEVGAKADVADSSAGGFTIKVTVTIHAAPADVYHKLINVGDWWSSNHTFSHDAHNLSIEEKPMGCFCEKLPGGGFVRHMEVIYAEPGKTLRMSGAIGPLQAFAASGAMTISLSPAPEGTTMLLIYTLGGYAPQGLAGIAPVVDTVLTEQVTRFKSYVETGDPAKK